MSLSVNTVFRVALLCAGCVFLPVLPAFANEPIESIHAIRLLTPKEAAEEVQVVIEAQVIRDDLYKRGLFLYDGTDGIYLEQLENASLFDDLKAGDIIRVEGITTSGQFLSTVLAESIQIVGRKPLPPASPLKPDEINNSSLDCAWRALEGRLVDMIISEHLRSITLTFEMYGGLYKVHIPHLPADIEKVSKLMFTRVRFNAVVGTVYNGERQFTGRIFFSNSADDFKPTGVRQATIKRFEIHELQRVNFDQDMLVRTRGIITHATGREVFLRGEQASMKALLIENTDVSPGDTVELTGVSWPLPIKPSFRAESLRKTGTTGIPEPMGFRLEAPFNTRFHHELVCVDAELIDVGESFGSAQNESDKTRVISLLCRAREFLFEAKVRTDTGIDEDKLRVGSRLRLVGICHLVLDDDVSWLVEAKGFGLQLRNEDDIVVLKAAPWWTAEHLMWASLILTAILVLVLVWVISLRRTVTRQTGIITETIERESILHERQRVARELHDNLDQGLTGTAVQLQSCRTFIDKLMTRLLDSVRAAAKTAEGAEDALAARLQDCVNVAEGDVQKSRQGLTGVQDMLGYCGEESRKAILDLRSGLLESMSLPEAVKTSLSALDAQFKGSITVDTQGGIVPLWQAAERNLLQVIREAVTNAVQHSGADLIKVTLAYDRSRLLLHILDNGSGFDPAIAAPAGRFGLQGMRERCMQIGADFTIDSGADGTCITVTWLNPQERETES